MKWIPLLKFFKCVYNFIGETLHFFLSLSKIRVYVLLQLWRMMIWYCHGNDDQSGKNMLPPMFRHQTHFMCTIRVIFISFDIVNMSVIVANKICTDFLWLQTLKFRIYRHTHTNNYCFRKWSSPFVVLYLELLFVRLFLKRFLFFLYCMKTAAHFVANWNVDVITQQ